MRRPYADRRAAMTCVPPADYRTYAFSDSSYWIGPTGGTITPLLLRAVLYISAVPSTAQRIITMYESAAVHGVRMFTGGTGLSSIQALWGGSGGYQITPQYTITSSDVGRLMVVHSWADTAGHIAIGGAEVGSGSAAVTVTQPASTTRFTVGRSQHNSGYACDPGISVVALTLGSVAMTPSEVAADAAAIMSHTRGIVIPSFSGELYRYFAEDVVTSTDWHDRIGDDCTLVRTGSPAVSVVP